MTKTLTLEMPTTLYERLKSRADKADRSVEAETIEVLTANVSDDDELGPEIEQALASLDALDVQALEGAARSRLAIELSSELESLHFKQQREGLSNTESARCEELVRAYEKAMLIRAHAAALLKERGIDVSHLLGVP